MVEFNFFLPSIRNYNGLHRYHYWRSTTAYWTRIAFPLDLPSINNVTNTPTVIGKRGKLIPCGSSLLALLPSNAPNSTALSILRSTAQGHFADWNVAWEVESGCVAEPLFDRYRLDKTTGGRWCAQPVLGEWDGGASARHGFDSVVLKCVLLL